MNPLPDIVVSERDFSRLEAMLQGLPAEKRLAHAGLSKELSRAAVVDSTAIPSSVVTMNSVVRFTLPPSPAVHELRLCFPWDIDGCPGRISVLTPVGTALLGLAEGQEITWAGPGGKPIMLRVEQVVFQPERARMAAN